jgi:hypothetical protein
MPAVEHQAEICQLSHVIWNICFHELFLLLIKIRLYFIQIDCVMLECGHMCTCTNCGKQMAECPICRQYVVRYTVFLDICVRS